MISARGTVSLVNSIPAAHPSFPHSVSRKPSVLHDERTDTSFRADRQPLAHQPPMAKRTSSTTSLARFARANSPEFTNRSLDFCNAFWGVEDGGVDVLFARMRGATRTIDELRGYWKERYAISAAVCLSSCQDRPRLTPAPHRATIEEDYAKQLARLAKSNLGRDEIGYAIPP